MILYRAFVSLKRPIRIMIRTSAFICGFIFLLLFLYAAVGIISDKSPVLLNVKNQLCSENFVDSRSHMKDSKELKMIYFVTPTFPRATQVPELTRLSHTLMHVPRIHWIVADDQPVCSDLVLNVLRQSGLPFTHISSPKPYLYKTKLFPRGVANRRAALDWLRQHTHEGILYFGDDDNTFDLKLFEEIRKTKRVSMVPVGLIGDYGISSPVVSDGKVVAYFDSWPNSRLFPVDMAGFAVNIEHLPPTASMSYANGLQEDKFLISLGIKMDQIEPLADNCSKVYVWHTKTTKFQTKDLRLDINRIKDTHKYEAFVNLLEETAKLGMAKISPDAGTVKTKVTKNRTSMDLIKGLS